MNDVKYYIKDKFPDMPDDVKRRIYELYEGFGMPKIDMQVVAKIRAMQIPYGMMAIKRVLMDAYPDVECSK